MGNLVLGLAMCILTYVTFTIAKSANESSENQRAIEATLQLQTFWNDVLDGDTRHDLLKALTWLDKCKRVAKEGPAADLLANESVITNIANMSDADKALARDLLGDTPTFADAMRYRTAISKMLNAAQAVASLRIYSTSPVVAKIIDASYRDTIRLRVSQAMPFIKSFRKSQELPHLWAPLTEFTER